VDHLGIVTAQEENHLRYISGLWPLAKSASGIVLQFASVSMMLGRIEFARMPVPFTETKIPSN
jgi:hypothetical protein